MSTPIKSRRGFTIVRDDPKKLCSDCTHGYLGDGGVFCRAVNELITNETVAESCDLYERSTP